MKMRRKKSRADVPSMAMGDIAFNLLIFFVILARVQDDSHLQWEPAQAENLDRAKHSKVHVVVDKNRDTYLNGQQISIAQLAGAIEENLGNTPAGERTVLLKVHKETTAVTFEPILEAISEAGGDLIHVVEEKKD